MNNFIAFYLFITTLSSLSAQTRYYCNDAAENRVTRSSTSSYCSNFWGKDEAAEDEAICDADQPEGMFRSLYPRAL